MFAALLQHHGQFELVIQLLRQMLRKNDRLFVTDDGVYVLEENNPGHDRVGKARFGGFLVMLPEIARGVEEFLRNNRRFEPDGGKIVKERFAMATRNLAPTLQSKVESVARRGETGLAAFEQDAHVGRNERVRQAIEGCFVLVVAQIESAGGIEIDDLIAADKSADA